MTYEKKHLDNGELNPLFCPRKNPWKGERKTKQKSGKSGKGGKTALWDIGHFVAIDGEGANTEDGRHIYTMIAALGHDQHYDVSADGLDTKAVFEFLLDLQQKEKRGMFVIFGGSYDANMWLHGTDKETLEDIKKSDGKFFVRVGDYLVRYVPRKYFALKRKAEDKAMVIWDVHGFFQQSFIKAVENWLPNHANLPIIKAGKAKRSEFKINELEETLKYCNAELECLQQIMDKLRAGVNDLGLKLSRLDGAGAVAAAIYKKHDIKQHLIESEETLLDAAEHAFFGGRIEIGKYGNHKGKIYHYDINSAYPAAQKDLPSLAHGKWIHYKNGINIIDNSNTLILSLVKWDNITNTRFCPFPYRSEMQNKVLFPQCGLNWIWKPELEAALRVKRDQGRDYWNIEILESYVFETDADVKAFDFIDEYYNTRQSLVAESKKTGIPNGQEKVIKLGINSLYGKTVQKVGYDEKEKRKPPYHNIVYAGNITAKTRAMLWTAAMQADDNIVCLATDGIYSTVPLKLDCPKEKIIGKWEAQTHDEMTLVQAGFYFLRDGEKWSAMSRGFDKFYEQADVIEKHDKILEAWRNNRYEIYLPCTRFIGYKTALISDAWFARWCTWYEMETDGNAGRRLKLDPHGTKRRIVDNGNPARRMLATEPEYNYAGCEMSARYSLPWHIEDDLSDTEIDLEHNDGNI